MNDRTTHFIRTLAAVLLCAALGSVAAAPKPTKNTTMVTDTSAARPDVATFCIGRFLIDLPTGSKLSGGNYKYKFARVEKPVAMSLEQFEKEVDDREAKLKAAKHRKEPSLLRVALQPDKTTRILAFWEEDFTTKMVNIEGYKWLDGTRFLIKDEAGTSPPKTGSISKQDLAIADTRTVLSRLRPRADTDIPTEPGYCFEGGFIANGEWENEEANVDIDIAGQPDAFVSVWIYPLASRKRDKPLLERMGGAVAQLGNLAASIQVLRKGDRDIGPFQEGSVTIGPFKGQEYLVSGPNSGGIRAHSFVWETQGEGTLQEPSVKIELETGHQDAKGNPQQTRLTNAQALELWDRIVKSFRLRPTSPPPVKTSEATSPKAPLGELAATGRACPQAGWWECAEASALVQGGRRQFFNVGQQMPHAVLLGEPSVWQKLKGEQPTHQTATIWRLVGYQEADVPLAAPAPPDNQTDPSASSQES